MADLLIALTVKQPWASAIIYGDKDIENRVWRTGYRGRLLIHAGKAVDWLAPDHAWTAAGLAPYRRGAPRVAWTASLPLSVILGAVTLTGCHLDAECRHLENGRYVAFCSRWAMRDQAHWQVDDKRPFRTLVPADGRQRLWMVTDEAAIAAVREQIDQTA
jgi:hypothetical protein